MSNDIVDAITAKLTGERFAVGQRVRIKEAFGKPLAGAEGVVVGKSGDHWNVDIDDCDDPEQFGIDTWNVDWLEPIHPHNEEPS